MSEVITYGDPEYPHFTEWVDSLATTDLPQGKGRLATINIETGEVAGYCCLGQGCTLLPTFTGVEVFEDGEYEDSPPFNDEGYIFDAYSLAPIAFVEWLGCDLDDHAEFDLILDIPEQYRLQGPSETTGGVLFPLFPEGVEVTTNPSDYQKERISCSSMNDRYHLTFPQISDMLRYFGIVKQANPA